MRKEGDKEKIYFVGDDCHLLCVGATRSGKSRCLVLESICLLGLAGESIFCSDPKAELFHYTADFLKKLGYEVLVLDFKNPEKSMRYNLLQPIIDAISEGDTDRAEMLAWDLTNNLVGKPEGEKIWTNGECSIIAAAILCVVCDNQKRPEFQNMTNVYWFISEMCRTIGNKMPLLEYVKKLSPSHPARGASVHFPMWRRPYQRQLLHLCPDHLAAVHLEVHLRYHPYQRFYPCRYGQ